MANTYNIYCDESCHLENDGQQAMVLGAVYCPAPKSRQIAEHLRSIKTKHQLSKTLEIKWTKVSPARLAFYKDVADYFFREPALSFRAVVVPDKSLLRHELHDQTHDDWYYKMYFTLLKVILDPHAAYRIYLDIKDTHSFEKAARLHQVLCNNFYDFNRDIIERIQPVHSSEVEQVQLADLLVGALSYKARGLKASQAKTTIVEHIAEQSGYSLTNSTLLREQKFNLLVWRACEHNHD